MVYNNIVKISLRGRLLLKILNIYTIFTVFS